MNIQSAGARLKQLRLEKGISLEEVQKKTKIHLNVLRAIEGDSLSDLSPIYLKSFIRIYCNYLGVDSKDYLGVSAQSVHAAPVLNSKVGRPVGTRLDRSRSFIKDTAVKISSLRPPKRFNKLILFIVLAVLAVLVLTKLFSLFANRKAKDVSEARSAALSAPAQPKQKTQADARKKGAAASKDNTAVFKMQKEITSGFTLGVLAKDKCWISLKVDGRLAFHGVLARGRFESWKAKNKIEFSLGDAAAVELQVNDQRFPTLGRRGQSIRVLVNKDGLKIGK
ncbi:MAG: helix-turn-helix domain-containing protein [Candidatus Omnitrophota bacterium]